VPLILWTAQTTLPEDVTERYRGFEFTTRPSIDPATESGEHCKPPSGSKAKP